MCVVGSDQYSARQNWGEFSNDHILEGREQTNSYGTRNGFSFTFSSCAALHLGVESRPDRLRPNPEGPEDDPLGGKIDPGRQRRRCYQDCDDPGVKACAQLVA